MEQFQSYQYEVYLGGLAGIEPQYPYRINRLERRARETLDPGAYGYVAGGANTEDTMRANREAFRRWRIVPRMLRDVSTRDLSTTVLGTKLHSPVLLAPIGVQSIIHPDGELATARASASVGVPIVLSTASSNAMEPVAEAMGDVPRWYQLYWPGEPELAASFLDRAKAAGYSAIVVTLDTGMLGWRPRDLETAYLPFLHGEGIANYVTDPVFRAGLPSPPEEDMQQTVLRFGQVFADPSLTWERLAFLREHTDLPIVLKGILSPEDARQAADAGVDGLVVSNHGGRQVDGAIATLDALPAIAAAVGDRLTILMDSGIRTGADVIKALALGAKAVLLGRPYAWGLAVGGEDGVRHVLRSFLADLDVTLGLSGYRALGEIEPGAVVAVRPN